MKEITIIVIERMDIPDAHKELFIKKDVIFKSVNFHKPVKNAKLAMEKFSKLLFSFIVSKIENPTMMHPISRQNIQIIRIGKSVRIMSRAIIL